jgi:hypothetical protein
MRFDFLPPFSTAKKHGSFIKLKRSAELAWRGHAQTGLSFGVDSLVIPWERIVPARSKFDRITFCTTIPTHLVPVLRCNSKTLKYITAVLCRGAKAFHLRTPIPCLVLIMAQLYTFTVPLFFSDGFHNEQP